MIAYDINAATTAVIRAVLARNGHVARSGEMSPKQIATVGKIPSQLTVVIFQRGGAVVAWGNCDENQTFRPGTRR